MIIKSLHSNKWLTTSTLILVTLLTFTNCADNRTGYSKISGLSFCIDSISYCFEDTVSKDQMSPYLYFYFTVKNTKHKNPIQLQIEKFKDYQPEKDSILLKYGEKSIKLLASFRTNHFVLNYRSDYKFTVSPDPIDIISLIKNQPKHNLKQQESQFIKSDILLYIRIENKSDPLILKAIKPKHFKIAPKVCLDKWF